jgi:hypothetical protein
VGAVLAALWLITGTIVASELAFDSAEVGSVSGPAIPTTDYVPPIGSAELDDEDRDDGHDDAATSLVERGRVVGGDAGPCALRSRIDTRRPNGRRAISWAGPRGPPRAA